jgi:antitoxin VapB
MVDVYLSMVDLRPMSLNIKNERTHALVRELATLSGMSQTDAVEDAVARRLEQLRGNERAGLSERLLELGRRSAERMGPERFENPDVWLYDENGLPK